jgi:hypothetical protein
MHGADRTSVFVVVGGVALLQRYVGKLLGVLRAETVSKDSPIK